MTPVRLISDAEPGAAVEFRHVSRLFPAAKGHTEIAPSGVTDLSLVVEGGEICVLVGPSGCGKTTTLKMVNRLVEPSSGRVLVGGVDVSTLDVVQLRRQVGYVIQQVGLFPHRTIADNVATVPRLLGWQKDRIASRVDELLGLVGLDPSRVGHRFPSQLSGGERQRVGVARALAASPKVMLMDEPFGAVDPIVRGRLQEEFLRIQKSLKMTVLFVTHDIDEAIRLGDRVAVMQEGGVLAQYGRPVDLVTRPASDYVADFVGHDRVLKYLALLRIESADLVPGATPEGAPKVPSDISLRDALSAMLGASAQAAEVVDGDGTQLGLLTLEAIGRRLEGTPSGIPSNTGAQ